MHQVVGSVRNLTLVGVLVALLASAVIVRVRAEGEAPLAPRTTDLATTFTYQGRLEKDGVPVSGTCDLTFGLFDAASGGTGLVTALQQTNVPVSNGLFTARLDFGVSVFQGDDRYLAVSAHCPAGSGSFVSLTPRQALTATPYAIYAQGTAEDTTGWSLTGNAGTNVAVNFIGTTDNQPFEIRVNNFRVYRAEPANTSPNIIGGIDLNSVTSGVVGATISGGGEDQLTNRITDDKGTIGGGTNNQAGDGAGETNDRPHATVGGGFSNTASGNGSTIAGGTTNSASNEFTVVSGGTNNLASGSSATVSGGTNNTATDTESTVGGGHNNAASGLAATIAGGYSNEASEFFAAIGGGTDNVASGSSATIAGGRENTSSGSSTTVGGGESNSASLFSSTVAGGELNTASAGKATVGGGGSNTSSGSNATIGGGQENVASGFSATIGGGNTNTASGPYAAVAGGLTNTASGTASFVGSGFMSQATGLYSVVPGGVNNVASGDYSLAAGYWAKATQTGSFVWADNQTATFTSPAANTYSVRASGGIWLGTSSTPVIGAGQFISTSTGANLTTGGVWTNTSDKNLKTNFNKVDTRSVLETLMAMPVTTWNYKVEGDGILRMGPTAQDFYAAFGLGDDDKAIGTVDAQGVAFAAIQGLYATVQDENASLRAENAQMQSQIGDLQARLERVESAAGITVESDSSVPGWAWLTLLAVVAIGGAAVLRKVR